MKNYTPTVAQLRLWDGGSSYAVRLRDGRLIMFDGGMSGDDYEYNLEGLVTYLDEATEGNKPYRIAAWIITHFDLDHVDLASRFLVEHKEDVKVEKFIYNHPGHTDTVRCPEKEAAWEAAMAAHPEAERALLKTGDVYSFPGVTVKVLISEAESEPNAKSQNDLSAALRLKFDTGRVFLALGDCSPRRLHRLRDPESALRIPDEELRADVVWVAHHGFSSDTPEWMERGADFYRAVDPAICLFSMNLYDYTNDRRMIKKTNKDNWFMRHTARDCYHHGETTVVDMENLTVISENKHTTPENTGHLFNTREEFLAAIGEEEMPENFGVDFLDTVVEFETQGTPFLADEFVADLEERYGMFYEKFDFVMSALKLVRENKTAALYSLLAKKMLDRRAPDERIFLPELKNVPESESLAFEMAPFFAQVSHYYETVDGFSKRGVPEDIIKATLRGAFYGTIIVTNTRRGRDGFIVSTYLSWNMHYLNCDIMRIGVLNFELKDGFTKYARAFRSRESGEIKLLVNGHDMAEGGRIAGSAGLPDTVYHAAITETDEEITGYEIDDVNGVCTGNLVTLKKSEWYEPTKPEDKVLSVHIPIAKNFNRQTINESYKRCLDVIDSCYPEYANAPIVCVSWIISPQLNMFLKPESNIVGFLSRYHSFPVKSMGLGVRGFLFSKTADTPIEELPEDTSLQRNVKAYLLTGKYVYESGGIIFRDEIKR